MRINNKIMNNWLFIFIVSYLLVSCIAYNKNIIKDTKAVNDNAYSKWSTQIPGAFLKGWDLDGDGLVNDISFQFSGGAHCCYKIEITLSSDMIKRKYPFEMDGGYAFGVDNSQPGHFNIKDFDQDGLPEIFMEIETYHWEKFPIDNKWTEVYGIKSNHILFDYKDGKLNVKDYIID